jgi:hypothetical protein
MAVHERASMVFDCVSSSSAASERAHARGPPQQPEALLTSNKPRVGFQRRRYAPRHLFLTRRLSLERRREILDRWPVDGRASSGVGWHGKSDSQCGHCELGPVLSTRP